MLVVSLQKQMTVQWGRLARVVRELVACTRMGGASAVGGSTGAAGGGQALLLAFLDFLLGSSLPIALLVTPSLVARVSD